MLVTPPAPPKPALRRWTCVLVGIGVVAAIWLAYASCLSGPFVFDDIAAIVENPTLRDFSTALRPPSDRGLPVTGRPVANFSFAINHTLNGLDPAGYRSLNVGLHAVSALLLFGVVRRTVALAHPLRRSRDGHLADHTALAAASALLWALHPLATAAVAYVSQRTEVLVTLWYLALLYGLARSATSPRPRTWLAAASVACWLGMGTKEVMVSAPVVALLYDRLFVAGTFADALRQRRWFYFGLAASWLLLGWLMLQTGDRAGTAGFAMGVSPWQYLLTQCSALARYLRLALWPAPLVFDYGGTRLVAGLGTVLLPALGLIALLSLSVLGYVRRSAYGFIGLACFAILAPTSSFIPVADTVFEHRFYLPLAGVTVALTSAAWRVAGPRLSCFALAASALLLATIDRNHVYRSEIALWSDTAAKRPDNVRAHYTLGTALAAAGRADDALREFQRALHLDGRSPEARNGLANLLAKLGRDPQAIEHYEAALAISPSAETHSNLANVLLRLGRAAEARRHYEAALRLRPAFADAHNNLGNLLAQVGELAAAAEHYEAALQLRPDLADAHANLGNVRAQSGQFDRAIEHYQAALRLRPDFADAHFNLATTYVQQRQWSKAVEHYEAVQRLDPNYHGAREALAQAKDGQAMFGDRH